MTAGVLRKYSTDYTIKWIKVHHQKKGAYR